MDIEQLQKLKKELVFHYGEMHRRLALAATYYNGEFTVATWKDVTPYRPATAKNKVDVTTDHVMAIGRTVDCPAWGESERAKLLAGKLTRFGEGVMTQLERHSGGNQVRGAVKHLFLYGMSDIKGPVFIKEHWPKKPKLLGLRGDERKEAIQKYEERRSRAWPFETKIVNPLELLVDPDMDNPQFVIEAYKRKAMQIRRNWPKWDKKHVYDDMADVEWWEYWDDRQYCLMAGNEPVTDGFEPNWLGYNPHHIAYSGLGEHSPNGGPEYKVVGIVYPSISAFDAEAELKTATTTHVKLETYGERVFESPPAEDVKLATAPGEGSVVPEHYHMRIERPVPLNPDALKMIGMVGEDIDTATASPMLEGDKPTGIASGFLGAIFVGQARVRMEGPTSNTSLQLGNYLNHCGQLVRDVIEEPVTVRGTMSGGSLSETVKPEDFDDDPQFVVKFDGKTPEERDRRFELGMKAQAANALSWETIAEDFYGVDPSEERLKMLQEEVLKDPQLRKIMAVAAMHKFGMDKFREMLGGAAKLKESGEQPQGPQAPSPTEPGRQMQRLDNLSMPRELGSPQEQTNYEPG